MRFHCLFLFTIVVPSYGADATSADRAQIESARASLARNEFGKAIGELLPVIRDAKRRGDVDRTVEVALADLGYAYRMNGQCRDAVAVLTEATAVAERTGASPDLRGRIGVRLLGSYLDCGETGRAVGLWEKTLDPLAASAEDPAPVWAAGATALMARHRYREAEDLYTRALATWKGSPLKNREQLAVASSNRSVARAHLGRTSESAADAALSERMLQGSTLPDSTRATVLNNVGVADLMNGTLADSEEAFRKALSGLAASSACPCRPAILANLASMLRKTGRSTEAKAAQREAGEWARRLEKEEAGPTVDTGALTAFGLK